MDRAVAGTRQRERTPTIRSWRGTIFLAIASVGAILVPWIGTSYHISFFFFLFIAILLTETYDILAGYTGYINLGHGAFFGLGAYVFGIVILNNGGILFALLLAPVAAVLFAAMMAYPLFRLRGAYFAIATFGVLKLMEVLASNLRDLTGGTTGLSIPPTNSTLLTYYLAALLCLFSILLNAWIATSRLGLGLLTIREDEEVAEGAGVNTVELKRLAMLISAVLPGWAGAVYMWQTTYIDPASAFGSSVAFAPVIMAMLGGSGTVLGPVIGAIFLTLVEETLWSHVGYLQLTMYGVVLVCVGIFMPGGLVRSNIVARFVARCGLRDHYGYQPSRLLRTGTSSVRSQGGVT
jgi:branched-chain amino acid transport system permease protein